MSTTVARFVGPRTRSRAKSDSEAVRPVEDMTGEMERLAGQKRKASKGIPSVTPEEEVATDSEMTPSSPVCQIFPSEGAEQVPLQVWNEMFSEHNFHEIAEESEYISEDIANLISTAQHANMTREVTEEIKRKKETFLKAKGNDPAKLRENLRRLFTVILIRRVKAELTENRKTAEYRLEELSAEHEKKNVSWRMVNEKQELMRTRATKAQKALTELLELATNFLSSQELSSDNEKSKGYNSVF